MDLAKEIREKRIKLGYRAFNVEGLVLPIRKFGRKRRLSSKTMNKIKSTYSLVGALNEERGFILGISTEVENWIDNIIAVFFFRDRLKQKNIRSLFKAMILEKEFNLMQKVKLIKEIMIFKGIDKEKDSEEFRALLHKFVKIRNAFAHGEIVFKQKFQPYLVYYSGERQVDPLTPTYFEEIYNTISSIRVLSDKIRKNISGWKV